VGDYDIGTARGRIVITASNLGRTTAALDSIGNKLLLIGGAAAVGFGYAVKKAADFEEQMSRFQAVSDSSVGTMEQIRKKAIQLGQDSAYGATEVVKAFAELGYAGASAKEIIEGLGDATVYLAAAGELPLADAATSLINIMRQFNIPASGAVEISNELARAANASTIDVKDLTVSMKYAGPVAAAMGLSFDETAKTLALFGNAGIKGSTGGTSLRGVLIGLLAISAPAQGALHDLGLDTNEVGNNFFDAAGKMKSLPEVAEILRGSFGKLGNLLLDTNGKLKSTKEINKLLESSTISLTDKQKLQAFTTLFQRRALSSALVLAKGGKKAYDDLGKSAQYQTTAQELMNKKLDNLKGSLKILKSSFETLLITLGTAFLPTLKKIADGLKDLTNWFSSLSPETQQMIVKIFLAIAAFLLLTGVFLKITSTALKVYKAFKDLAAGFKIIKGVMSLPWKSLKSGLESARIGFMYFKEAIIEAGAAVLTSPIFWIVVAILAIAAAAYFVWTRWDEIWNWIVNHKAFALLILILAAPVAMFVLIVGGLKWLYSNWDKIWKWIKNATKDAVEFIKARWHDLEDAMGAVKDVATAVKNAFVTAWNAIVKVVQTAWHIIEPILGYINDRLDDGKRTLERLANFWIDAWKLVGEALSAVWENVIQPFTQFILDRLDEIWQGVLVLWGLWTGAWGLVAQAVQWAWENIIQPTTQFIKDRLAELGAAVLWLKDNVWAPAWQGIKDAVFWAYTNIIQPFLQFIKDRLTDVGTAIDTLKGVWRSAWHGIENAVSDAWEFIKGIVHRIIEGIKDAKSAVESLGDIDIPGLGGGGPFQFVPGLGPIGRGLGLPGFALGGIVPGKKDSAQVIQAHGGEIVVPTDFLSRTSGINRDWMGALVGKLSTANRLATASAALPARTARISVPAGAGADPALLARIDQQNALLRDLSKQLAETEHPVVAGDMIVNTGQITNPINVLKYSVTELKAAAWRRSIG
jgi:phage-related protein